MKKLMALLLALLMMTLPSLTLATNVQHSTYALAPANPTQENVEKLQAEYQPENQDAASCAIAVMEPTQLTVETLKAIFEFVDVDRQPPAQYFPENVQEKMARIIQGDPDRLYMPEFMSLLPEKMQLDADVQVDMHMTIDYQQGQLVLVVLGRETNVGIEWKPLPAQVIDGAEEDDIVRFVVPADVMARYAGGETLFALLAEKPGVGAGDAQQGIPEEHEFVPSKNASDIVFVTNDAVRNAAGETVDCRIIIVSRTKLIEQELERLTSYFTRPENRPIRYFDTETVNETALILQGTEIDSLIPYEITQVMVEDYQQPYGDVTARFLFPTPFAADKAMIALIGIPEANNPDTFCWMPLRVEKADNGIDITFSSSVLPTMMQEAALLLVMSEPIEE
ncbi:MAG: hypothetical protein IJ350_02100 [Clostridia bacterium]|nr:hypothetical protein [Clostridia bacterium]